MEIREVVTSGLLGWRRKIRRRKEKNEAFTGVQEAHYLGDARRN